MGIDQRWWALNLIFKLDIFIEKNRIASLEAITNLIKFKLYKLTKFQELRCYR